MGPEWVRVTASAVGTIMVVFMYAYMTYMIWECVRIRRSTRYSALTCDSATQTTPEISEVVVVVEPDNTLHLCVGSPDVI